MQKQKSRGAGAVRYYWSWSDSIERTIEQSTVNEYKLSCEMACRRQTMIYDGVNLERGKEINEVSYNLVYDGHPFSVILPANDIMTPAVETSER